MKSCRRFDTMCQCLLVLGFLVMAATAEAVPQPQSAVAGLPANFGRLAGPQAVEKMPVAVVDPNPEAVRLRFSNPSLEFGEVTLDDAVYESIRLSGESATLEAGSPELPAVPRMVLIGNKGKVSVSVVPGRFDVRDLTYSVVPTQPMETESVSGPVATPLAKPSPEVYGANDWYPKELARISDPATLRDARFVVVTVYPVQYNPVTRQIRVYRDIDVQVTNAGGTGPNEITIHPESISPDFKRLYQTFENFHGSSLDELPVLPGKYLVICPNTATVIAEAQRLVNWKKRRGLDASYVTTVTSGTSADAIRSYISNLYTSSNGQLEYVCLMGDPNASASWQIQTHSSQYDNYYGTLISGGPNPDPVPDVVVGRLSCRSDAELNAVVTKTINYEATPYTANSGWFTRTWCAAHTGHVPSNASTKNYTRQIMLQHGVTTAYWDVYPDHVNTTTLNARLAEGISVFNHRMSWISEILNEDVDGVPVTPMQPFVMAITCGTGNFTSDGTSEHWLRPSGQGASTPKGAIGCVGLQGSSTHVPYNNILDAGAMYGLYVLDIQTQGMALLTGKLELYRNYWVGDPTDVNLFCYWANLMGDPAVPIWRKVPEAVTVVRPATAPVGTNNVAVTVTRTTGGAPVADAMVCLYKGTETYSRAFTDANGQVNLPCSTATAGYMQITITKDNIRSYVDSIQVQTTAASLSLGTVTVDDNSTGGTSGDANGVLNPGEIVDLSVSLRNVGTSTTVTGISGTLTTTAHGVTITQATSSYPNIAAGANAAPATPYRVTITEALENEPVAFLLNVTSSAGPQTIRIDLVARAADVVYTASYFSGPGATVDPGENGDLTVTFRNSGSRPLSAAYGFLRSLDPLIHVTDSVGTFGAVAAGATGVNTANPFHIEISAGSYNGHKAVMELVILDTNGFRDSTLFDSSRFTTSASNFYLTIGMQGTNSPTGPDAYGYYAFDNTETQPTNSGSLYDWVEIQSMGTNLNFSDVSEDDDDVTVVTLPFSFNFYGQSFGQLTICSNGWLAFGSYPDIDDFRNYRMGSPIGPPFQVAAYWDDLKVSGTSNVFTFHNPSEHYFVVEWVAQTLWSSTPETFQVILYDPTYYPSRTGDGKVKVQYNTVNCVPNSTSNDNDYATVGIQNGDHSIGVDYCYWNAYTAGSSALTNGRAIMFTTDATGQLNPSVDVTQPQGGEAWFIGQTYSIQWRSTAVSGNVNVALNRNYPSGAWETIFANTPNDGRQFWNVTGPASTTARIRVTGVLNPAAGDTSDGNFTLVQPSATLLQPNGGESLTTGTLTWIRWTSIGLGVARVDLNRNYPSGAWEEVSPYAADSLRWLVSGNPTFNARFRVIGLSLPSVGDTSNANFAIGVAPYIIHDPRSDVALGAATIVTKVTDEIPGFTTKLFYRQVGVMNYDSLLFTATGHADEYAATTPTLATGKYEYFIRSTDPGGLSRWLPASGTYRFDVGPIGTTWLSYDDGTAENFNWVDGPGFKWAVKFDPGTYPYYLNAGRFAVCPTCPGTFHDQVTFEVILADGPGGLPGTVVFADTTGSAGNVVGGLPSGGVAWVDVVTRVNGQTLQMNGPFYLAVANQGTRLHPSAFGTDTLGTRNHLSYVYDECNHVWVNEDATDAATRHGNRMIRANGYPLTAPAGVTVLRTDATNAHTTLRWTSTGAPFYHIYTATTPAGPYATLEGTATGGEVGVSLSYVDTDATTEASKRFYIVVASDTP